MGRGNKQATLVSCSHPTPPGEAVSPAFSASTSAGTFLAPLPGSPGACVLHLADRLNLRPHPHRPLSVHRPCAIRPVGTPTLVRMEVFSDESLLARNPGGPGPWKLQRPAPGPGLSWLSAGVSFTVLAVTVLADAPKSNFK